MKRKSLVILQQAIRAVCPLVLLAHPVSAAPQQKPNILIMLADDLGYADVGVQGCTDVPTPNIDSIARNGVRFTSGYVSAPVCSPSRAGLLTGRYQTRFGHELNHPQADQAPIGMPVDQKTAADWMKVAGYVTGHIGKWHLGNPKLPQYNPTARGFDESIWFPGQKKLPPLTLFRNGKAEKADERYVDEAMAREASAFITRHATKPWFLYVAFLTPHEPLDTPGEVEAEFSGITDPTRRKCASMISLLDNSVGRVLQALRDSGQEDRTLIVFLGDNGAPPKNGSRNTPLRGGKGSTWEGGIREPFVMQWKGMIPAGRVVDAPIISLDLLPTALAAAGVEVPADSLLDGVNMLPYLTAKTQEPPHKALFWRYGSQMAVRVGDWKLTRAIDREARPPVVKTGLFHIVEDVSEENDVAAEHPDEVAELQRLWDDWNRQNVAPLWSDDMTWQPRKVAIQSWEKISASEGARKGSNFREERVPEYQLPDPLVSADGAPVKTIDDWNDIRRPELMTLFREHMYGIRPGTPYEMKFSEVARLEDVYGIGATGKQVRATITAKRGSYSFDFMLVTPKSDHPVPLVVMINNRRSTSLEKTIGEPNEFWPVEKLIRKGYATACFVTSDVDPDDSRHGYEKGIRALLDDPESDPETRWRCISSWGWGASRVLDYCLQQPGIDPERTAVVGHSRGGKTSLWAGAEDTRFKLVYANDSGSAGAKLTRRIYGGTIGFTTKVFPHWLCAKSASYGGNESKMPVDQHLLIALIAPRAVYVASADRDLWADPKGEYLSLVGAAPVYELFGVKHITNPNMPALDQPRHVGKTGYHVRAGNHNLGDVDWNHFLDFAGSVFKTVTP